MRVWIVYIVKIEMECSVHGKLMDTISIEGRWCWIFFTTARSS